MTSQNGGHLLSIVNIIILKVNDIIIKKKSLKYIYREKINFEMIVLENDYLVCVKTSSVTMCTVLFLFLFTSQLLSFRERLLSSFFLVIKRCVFIIIVTCFLQLAFFIYLFIYLCVVLFGVAIPLADSVCFIFIVYRLLCFI